MSNPKVFEFAKEIGMTPLALMDRIREWKLPVKSHMAELEPDVLEEIKVKLASSDTEKAAKPKKKATARKSPAKKVAAPGVKKTAAKTGTKAKSATVVRRKAGAVAAAAETVEKAETPVTSTAKTIRTRTTKAEAQPTEEISAQPQTLVTPPGQQEPEVLTKPTVAASQQPESPVAVEAQAEPTIEPSASSAEAATPQAGQPEAAAAQNLSQETQAAQAPTPPPAPTVSRKKEVVVGSSGVASSTTPVNTPRRNIVGRMDLSRVQPPPGAGGRAGGTARPGGFSGPPRSGVNRGIRAGFVAQSAPIVEQPVEYSDADKAKKDYAKRSKRLEGAAASQTAKERELEEQQQFNAVEFRKRELVFQPRKKREALGRTAMQTQITTPKASKRVLEVYGSMKLSVAAQSMGLKAPQLVKVLMQNGVMANMNTELDYDTLALIAPEFGWEAKNIQKSAEEIVTEVAFGELEAEPTSRPPVVTIMGHVDHGKTSLLDAIRSAKVAEKEAGGITQHIGAYSVSLDDGYTISFLDTPGHEAFTAMRARGANATDVAVIVVAADDGMMPQTQEAISHAKAANVPIIVAINKMDKPGANPDKIKQQLTEMELVPEEWGGNTIYVPVSALKKTGIDELLEQIKLVAELQELKANPKRSGTGLVIEAKMEKGKGPVATLLVKDGFIEVGQYIVVGTTKGRIRHMMNDRGETVERVEPGYPVEIQGLEQVPAAGDRWDIVENERQAEDVARTRHERALMDQQQQSQKKTLEEIFAKQTQGDLKTLPIIVKADVHGSVEAILGLLSKLNNSEVRTQVLLSAVGGISESDVLLAHTSQGMILGFNVRPDTNALNKAKQMGVEIRTYSIVYEMVDDMRRIMTGMLSPDIVEKIMGRAEIRNTFSVPKVGTIAGCFVVDGKIQRSNQFRLIREGKIVYEGKISSLKRFKDDAKEVAQGYECGVGIENFNDLKIGDVIEAYVKEEKERELKTEANV